MVYWINEKKIHNKINCNYLGFSKKILCSSIYTIPQVIQLDFGETFDIAK